LVARLSAFRGRDISKYIEVAEQALKDAGYKFWALGTKCWYWTVAGKVTGTKPKNKTQRLHTYALKLDDLLYQYYGVIMADMTTIS
jgi:hypothetical protein